MFKLFKKEKTDAQKDAELRASLAARLADYVPDVTQLDTTDTSYTDVDFGHGLMRVPKINVECVEELGNTDFTLADIVEDSTVNHLTLDDLVRNDPWAVNPADSTQWTREENNRDRIARAKR